MTPELSVLKTAIAGASKHTPTNFDKKAASFVKLDKWDGGKVPFREVSKKFKNWADALHPGAVELLEHIIYAEKLLP